MDLAKGQIGADLTPLQPPPQAQNIKRSERASVKQPVIKQPAGYETTTEADKKKYQAALDPVLQKMLTTLGMSYSRAISEMAPWRFRAIHDYVFNEGKGKAAGKAMLEWMKSTGQLHSDYQKNIDVLWRGQEREAAKTEKLKAEEKAKKALEPKSFAKGTPLYLHSKAYESKLLGSDKARRMSNPPGDKVITLSGETDTYWIDKTGDRYKKSDYTESDYSEPKFVTTVEGKTQKFAIKGVKARITRMTSNTITVVPLEDAKVGRMSFEKGKEVEVRRDKGFGEGVWWIQDEKPRASAVTTEMDWIWSRQYIAGVAGKRIWDCPFPSMKTTVFTTVS